MFTAILLQFRSSDVIIEMLFKEVPVFLCTYIPQSYSWQLSLIGEKPSVDLHDPGCLEHALMTLQLPCALVEIPWYH